MRDTNVEFTSKNSVLTVASASDAAKPVINIMHMLVLQGGAETLNIDGVSGVELRNVVTPGLQIVDASKNEGGVNLNLTGDEVSKLTKVTRALEMM